MGFTTKKLDEWSKPIFKIANMSIKGEKYRKNNILLTNRIFNLKP